MRISRFVLFLFVIVIGVALGLVYGWVLNPPPYANLKLNTLRPDYQADYVLMTAEVYRKDNNLAQAVRRLALLSDQTPASVVGQALLTARDLQYARADLETIAYLAQALQVPVDLSTIAPTATQAAP